MERLSSISGLVVSQQKEWGEIVTGFETKNRYAVMAPTGEELFLAAQQAGVLFSRGELFHSDGSGRNTFRLTYSTASLEQIESGVEILGKLMRERWPGRLDPPERPAAETMPIF